MSQAILEFTHPLDVLKKAQPSLSHIRNEHNLNLIPPTEQESEVAKFTREADNSDRKEMAKIFFNNEVKAHTERVRDLTQNLTILWATILGQCTPALQEEINGEPDYIAKAAEFDSIWLLQTLQKITAGVNKTTNKYYSAFKAIKSFYATQQTQGEGIDEFFHKFDTAKDLVQLFGADVANVSALLAKERMSDPNATSESVMQKFLAVALVMNSDKFKYQSLWNKLENDLLMGQDSYPTSLSAATHLLTNWKTDSTRRANPGNANNPAIGTGHENPSNPGGRSRSGVNFAQVPIPANDDFSSLPGYDPSRPNMAPSRKFPHNISDQVKCTRCHKHGHYATACPFLTESAPQLFQYYRPSVQLNQSDTPDVFLPGSIIVDSGSTFNCFRDSTLLSDIHPCAPFTTFSNGGGMTYNSIGVIDILPELESYHNPECLVNIVSLDLLQSKYRTIFDSEIHNSFKVEVSETKTITFEGFGSGLYLSKLNTVAPYCPLSLLNTVHENKQFYNRREIVGAEAAREQQGQIGWPSDQEYYEIIRDNKLKNSKATLDDLRRAEHIYGGPAVNLLKGKTVYKPVNTNSPFTRVHLPPIILKTHPTDSIDVDFLYCQGAPYLLIKSHLIKFQGILAFNRISKRNKKTSRITYKRGPKDIIIGIEKVLTVFKRRGFNIDLVHADNEFLKLDDKLSIPIEFCAAGQHVPRIERGIRSLKDRTRCFWVPLPFKRVPKLMVDECLVMVTTCLNDFPHKNGISQTLSPAGIVLGRAPIDGNNLKATFGRYYEVYCGTDNTNKERRVSAICLRPSNSQGGYYFMSLDTGKRIHGYRFTELSMPDHVIDTVHTLAESEDALDLDADGCPIFEWEIGHPVAPPEDDMPPAYPLPNPTLDTDTVASVSSIDDDEDANNDLLDEDDDDDDDASLSDAPPILPSATPTEPAFHDESRSDSDNDNNSDSDNNGDPHMNDDDSASDVRSEVRSEVRSDNEDPQHADSSDDEEWYSSSNDDDDDPLNSDINTANIITGVRSRTAATQPNIGKFGGKKYNLNMLNIGQDAFARFEHIKAGLYNTTVGICFTQMSAGKGIKLYGAKAVAAMFKEYKQLDDLKVLGRLNPDLLTPEQKRNALRAVNLIKIKRCGKVKGRTCANGSPQRKYIPREEATSPTLSMEALMGLLLINAYEGRDVAIFDVPGAYLHAKIPDSKFAILKIEGEFVDIMCDVNPEYKEDVRYENGKKVLYVQILRALYGMIESALLWYNLYTEVLLKEGFEINPYDRCVANKIINDKQCSIGWYVDDNILSHIDPTVVDSVIALIEQYFPGLVIERGKSLNFLGMELEFLKDGKVNLGLVQYIKGMIEELEEALLPFNENLDREYPHPAAKWLLTTNADAKALDEPRSDIYRKFVAKLIWVMKRGRPDVEPTNSFLCTRVKRPDKDDWHKFKRCMCWIKQTATDVRTIGADNLLDMLVMIDSAHAVHDDMRGHTGGITSYGTGIIDQKSSKQKMNTRSSTETEHVGTSEYLPKPIFFELFMEAQGYKPKMTLAKDNQSEIRMLINGKESCTSNSKHVAIKYFWCTDRIKNGNIKVRHCPTEKMVADYMSKPLQGKLFHTFRNVIMGWAHISTLFDIFSTTKERVGNNVNNGISVVVPKTKKMSYVEAAKTAHIVDNQNRLIANGNDPLDH